MSNSTGWKAATLEPKGQLACLVADMELSKQEERKLLQILKKEYICNMYQLSVLSDLDYANLSEKYDYPQGTLQMLQEKIMQIQLEESSSLLEVLIHATDSLDVSEEEIEAMLVSFEKANVNSAAELYRMSRSDLVSIGIPVGVATAIQLGFYLSNLVGYERAKTVARSPMLTLELELHKMDHLSVVDLHRKGSGAAMEEEVRKSLEGMRKKSMGSGLEMETVNPNLVQAYEEAEVRFIFTISFLSAHGLPKRKMMEVSPYLKASLNGVVHTYVAALTVQRVLASLQCPCLVCLV